MRLYLSVRASYLGFLTREDGTFFAYAGRSAGEPMRAAKACMGWGESAPIRANSAVADLGRPDSISLVCVHARPSAPRHLALSPILVDRAFTAPRIGHSKTRFTPLLTQ